MNAKNMRKKMNRFFSAVPHLKHIYGFYLKHSKVRSDVVLIESFHGKTIGDSSLVLAEELIKRCPGRYRIFFASSSIDEHSRFIKENNIAVELVSVDSLKYIRLLATAGILISNASLPTYFIRREGQVYLQTWHGTPLKTLGKSMRLGVESMYNVQHNFLQASYILQPNDFTRDVIMRDYFLDDLYTGKVVMCGYPRNRVLMEQDSAEKLRSKLGLDGYTVYAYMPTWRGTSNNSIEISSYFDEVEKIFERLDSRMRDDQIMFVNFHPILGGKFSFDGFSHIRPFPENIDTYEFLGMTDALITDYSSVFFDYSLTGRPVMLFTYDFDQYMQDRALYMDIDELPFRRVDDTDELAEGIRSGEYLSDSYEGTEYTKSFLKYDSVDNPEKLIRLVTDGDASDLTIIDYSRNKDRKWDIYCPSSAPKEADLAALQASAEEKPETLLLLYRKWFASGRLNDLLHTYGKIKYVITNNNVPASYTMLILRKLGVMSARKEFHDIDMKRRIPDIQAAKEIRKGYGKPGIYKTPYDSEIEYDSAKASLLQLSCSEKIIDLRILVTGCEKSRIETCALKLVSRVEEIVIPMETSVTQQKKDLLVNAKLTIDETVRLRPVDWDACIKIKFAGGSHYIKIADHTSKIKRGLRTKNVQILLDDGHIFFPFLSNWGSLKFRYREMSEYDSDETRRRETLALIESITAGRFLRQRKIILISEKFSKSAQDNSYYFFRYCMEKLPEKEKSRIYYVIDKRSADYKNIEKYKDNVIQFMSIKHMVYGMNARILVSTDSVTHFYAWQTRPSFVFDRIRKVPELFLQHGVTAMKKVDRLFGKHSSNPMEYFVATSETEQRIITDNFDYEKENVPITGFTRWDALSDKRDESDRFILIMPTWRAWLEGVTGGDFAQSEYYRNYMDLLTSERLKEILKKNGLRAVMYLHPIFAKYIGSFKDAAGDLIECVPFGSEPLNEIMMRSEMLITDYSSVCWDMLYMDKPVIFYQFDRDKYLSAHGSYVDLEHDLPGDNTQDAEMVLDYLEEHIRNGFCIKDEYKEQAGSYFRYKDDKNCKRTYDFLISKIGKVR